MDMQVIPSPSFLLAAALLALAPAGRCGEDLDRVYPATLAHSASGLFPVCSAEDVWELSSFEVSLGRDLSISCKKAAVAFGRHETNVLWAVVFPDQPAAIRSAQEGNGERARTIFLRFAPAELGQVFPAKTVRGRGRPALRAEALRIARHKIAWKWYTPAGNPTVVQPGWVLVDADTVDGARRFYGIERNAGKVHYVAEFAANPVPLSPPIERGAALAAFDEVVAAFDREYAGFVLLPDLRWEELCREHREQAGKAESVFGLAAQLGDLLGELQDLHVWVAAGKDFAPGFDRPRPLNASWKATQVVASASQQAGNDLAWGRTEDGIGYLCLWGLRDPELATRVDEALEGLADTWGLVLDLRFNGGGDELLGRSVAGRFLDRERVYSLNQYRAGPAHDDLGPKLERKAAPRGPWRYQAPVVVLTGQRTMSSAESLALMLAQCPQVTTMGDRTAGSSGNPRRIELECGITVNLPRWLDMDPEGRPIEHVGVPPDVPVECAPGALDETHDPVAEAAFARLRAIPAGERAPGKSR